MTRLRSLIEPRARTIQRYALPRRLGLLLLDGILAMLLGLAFYHRLIHPEVPVEDFARVFWVRAAIYAAAWVGLLCLQGTYRSRSAWTTSDEAWAVVRATVWMTLLGSLVFLVAVSDAGTSGMVLLALFPVQGLATIGVHLATRRWQGAIAAELRAAAVDLHAWVAALTSRPTDDGSTVGLDPAIGRGGFLRLLDRILLGQPLPFFIAVGLSLLARQWTITDPLYSADAYVQIGPEGIPTDFFISQGRWGLVLFAGLRDALDYVGYQVAASANLIAVFVFAHAGLLLANVVLRKPTTAEALVFVVIISLHPFATEFFYFTEGTLTFAVAFWLTSVALYACREMRRPVQAAIVGVALLVLATAIYQTAIAQALTVALLALVARLALLDGPQGRTPFVASRQVRLVLAVAASFPIYLLSARVVQSFTGVAAISRAGYSQLMADPLAKLHSTLGSINLGLWPPEGVIPRLDSDVLVGLLVLSALVLLWSMLRTGRWAAAAASGVLLAVGLWWSIGFSELGDTSWLVPRTMAVVGTFSAGLLMLGWRARSWVIWRAVLTTGIIILAVGYIGASNRILHDQRAMNRWDMAQANRILARLESEPGYEDLRTLAIIGGRVVYPVPTPTTFGDISISALMVPWSKLAVIEQATGYRFGWPTEAQVSTATEYCEAHESWPAAESVVLRNELGIVCMPIP